MLLFIYKYIIIFHSKNFFNTVFFNISVNTNKDYNIIMAGTLYGSKKNK